MASEQGAPRTSYSVNDIGQWICLAQQQVISNPNILWHTHNYFQATTSNCGDAYSLVDCSIPDDFSNKNDLSYQAYIASSQWNQNSDHYCCQNFQLGCVTS